MKVVVSPTTLPGPAVHPEAEQFWGAIAQGDFVLQRCTNCETVRFPPASICWRCLSPTFVPSPVSPRGILVTAIVVHRAPPGSPFSSLVPYRTGLFSLENGLRVPGRIVCDCDQIIPLGSELAMCHLKSDTEHDIYGFAHTCVH